MSRKGRMTMTAFGIHKALRATYDEALARLPEALKSEGFGVLTEIDIQSTLKQKLGVDFRRYKILGACNPTFAHRALELEPDLGALLPCNVVVYERDGATHVSAVDPVAMLGMVENPGLEPIGRQIRERVERAVEAVWKA